MFQYTRTKLEETGLTSCN